MSHLLLVSVHIHTLKHLFYRLILTSFLPNNAIWLRYSKPENIWLITTSIFTQELLVSCDIGRRQRRNFEKLPEDKKPWELGFQAKFWGPCRKNFFKNFSCSHWKVTKGLKREDFLSLDVCQNQSLDVFCRKGVLKNFAMFTRRPSGLQLY